MIIDHWNSSDLQEEPFQARFQVPISSLHASERRQAPLPHLLRLEDPVLKQNL